MSSFGATFMVVIEEPCCSADRTPGADRLGGVPPNEICEEAEMLKSSMCDNANIVRMVFVEVIEVYFF